MERTITVKGTGKVSVRPDMTVVSLTLRSVDKDYDKAMAQASEKLDAIQKAMTGIGFEKSDLKTGSFNVSTEYESIRDDDGNYRSVFAGYSCIQGLNLEFDFDTVRLSEVLSAIAGCISEPDLRIRFTVKDKSAVDEALLASAAENARKKAEILARASGVTLGELLSINYNWGELNVYSNTDYMVEESCVCEAKAMRMDITPEDINLRDSASFVWKIE